MNNFDEFDENDGFDDTDHSSEIASFLTRFNKTSLLKALAGLQLSAKNHGKNLRFEEMINDVLRSQTAEEKQVQHADLTEFFSAYYRSDYMEDPIDSHFTENVLFFSGNYTIFPGNFTDISSKLKAVLEAIFTAESDLTNDFKVMVEQSAMLMLTLSSLMASGIGIKRYAPDERECKLPLNSAI